jgi:serine/threonine protein phosphatase PrpC
MAFTAETIANETIYRSSDEANWGKAPLPPVADRILPNTLPENCLYDIGVLSDIGNERANNEDSVGFSYDEGNSLVAVVADGVGGYEGGELASRMAVDTTLASYREQSRTVAAEKRLYRAAQQANIEIYDRAIVVTELRNMSCTLTAIAIEGNLLHVAHVGDSRLYLIRDQKISQLTKDHTVAAEKVRQKRLSPEKAKTHPDHGTLTRSVGRELIAAVDRITHPVQSGDVFVICTDGMHNILDEGEIIELVQNGTAEEIAKRLIDTANAKGTYDNLTAAVCRIVGDLPALDEVQSWPKRLKAWLRSRA